MNIKVVSKVAMAAMAAMLFGAVGVTNAAYIGKFSGNDVSPPGQYGDKAAFIEAALTSMNIDFGTNVLFYDKADCNGSFASENGLSSATGCPGKSGEWWTQMPIDYLSVKAGNEFTLYSYEPPVANGSWSTGYLVNSQGRNRDVSHISFWYKERVSVPEPSAILLMGLGLLGMGLAGRKLRK